MNIETFLKAVFGAFAGSGDITLDTTIPTLRRVGTVCDYDLERGTDPDNIYALETFGHCPRAYMMKYLANLPLSIPFFAQVQEAVREAFADYAMGRCGRNEVVGRFEKYYRELVCGPYPLTKSQKGWNGAWLEEVGKNLKESGPWWDGSEWSVVDALSPLALFVAGRPYKGCLDLVLKNRDGALSVVLHDYANVCRSKTGEIGDPEHLATIARLKRRLYLYATAYEAAHQEAKGKIVRLTLHFYHPKNHASPIIMDFPWSEAEREDAVRWAGRMQDLVEKLRDQKFWPRSIIYRGNTDREDTNFCLQRCVHCLSCRWVGWHPEMIKDFVDAPDKVTALPEKYWGVKISLKPELDVNQEILKYDGKVIIGEKSVGVSYFKTPIIESGMKLIGDFRGKTIAELCELRACGVKKLDAMVKLFFNLTD